MNKKESKLRYNLVDILRGVAVICMIIYHTTWDLVYLFGVEIPVFRTNGAYIFQQYILWSFVIISGFCSAMGKKTTKRGLITLTASIVMTVATIIFIPDATIIFGVLTFLGTAMILTSMLKPFLCKIRNYIGLTLSALLFALSYNIPDGYLGFGGLIFTKLLENLYANYLTAFFGFPHTGFSSADYVPLIPWIFLYFFGFYLFDIFKSRDWLKHLSVTKIPPCEWLGRHALIIYLAHQPVIFVVLFIIFSLL